jgi:hypothetical protein
MNCLQEYICAYSFRAISSSSSHHHHRRRQHATLAPINRRTPSPSTPPPSPCTDESQRTAEEPRTTPPSSLPSDGVATVHFGMLFSPFLLDSHFVSQRSARRLCVHFPACRRLPSPFLLPRPLSPLPRICHPSSPIVPPAIAFGSAISAQATTHQHSPYPPSSLSFASSPPPRVATRPHPSSPHLASAILHKSPHATTTAAGDHDSIPRVVQLRSPSHV